MSTIRVNVTESPVRIVRIKATGPQGPSGGGGGAVNSVNGETGDVVLDAVDVGAEPTLTGATADVSPENSDTVYGGNAGAAFGTIKTTWTTIKAFFKIYFDTLYATLAQVATLESTKLSISAVTSYVLAKDHTDHSTVGTGEETLATVTIPGGTMGPNGALRITTLWAVTGGTVGTRTARIKFGGTNYASVNIVTTSITFNNVTPIRNRNSESSQIGGPAATGSVVGLASQAVVTSTVDTSVDVSLVFTGASPTSGETLILKSYIIEVLK